MSCMLEGCNFPKLPCEECVFWNETDEAGYDDEFYYTEEYVEDYDPDDEENEDD